MNAQSFTSAVEEIRDIIAAESMAGIAGLLAEAASGRNDAAALLLSELATDPTTVAPQVMTAVIANPEFWNDATKAIVRMAKKAAKEHAAAAAEAAAMPTLDMRPVNRLNAGQAVRIHATTFAAIKMPLYAANIAEVWEDPDDDEKIVAAPDTYAPAYVTVKTKTGPIQLPVYDVPGLPFGASPVGDRCRTFGINPDTGEMVELPIPNHCALPFVYAHGKGDPEGTKCRVKIHTQYAAGKWNKIFGENLANLPENSTPSRALDELATRAIKGERIIIVTHEYAGHGQQIVDEVMRRAAQGVHGQIKTAAHGGQRQIGMSAEHYSDRADRKVIRTQTATAAGPLHIKYRKSTGENAVSPDRLLVLHESPKGEDRFTWLDGMEMSRHGGDKDIAKLDRLALRAANGVTLTVISGRSDEHAASIAAEITRRAWVGVTKSVKVWAQDVCEPWFDYRNLVKVEGKHTQFYVLQKGERFVLLASPEGKTITVKPGKAQPLHGYWQKAIDPDGAEYEHWIDVRPRNEAKLRKLFQPVISDWLQEEPREFNEDEDDSHETALESFLTVSDEDAVYMKTALAGGNERAADLIRQGFDPEAAAEIEDEPRGGGRRGGPSAEKSALDKMFENVASAQEAKIIGARQATLSILTEGIKQGIVTEETVARLAHIAGFRDITITYNPDILLPGLDKTWKAQITARNEGVTRRFSAQGQFMGSKPIIAEINGQPLTEAQRLALKEKRYTYFAPLPGNAPALVIEKSAMTLAYEAQRRQERINKMQEQNVKAAEILAEKKAEDEALALKAFYGHKVKKQYITHQWFVQPLVEDGPAPYNAGEFVGLLNDMRQVRSESAPITTESITATLAAAEANARPTPITPTLPPMERGITDDKALAGWRIIDTTSAVLLAEMVADTIA